jgi:vancomycin resistance protein YoaR
MYLCEIDMRLLTAILLVLLVTPAESASWVEVSSYSTRFSNAEVGRASNIRLATKILNGKTIRPGSEFSFSNTIGPRTANTGFRPAPYIEGPEKVMVEGGGICLVSSVLYNAVLLAGLKILERHPHSRLVPYLPAGRDATVEANFKDLRFRNSLGTTLKIEAVTRGDRMVVRLLASQKPPYQIELESVSVPDPDGVLRTLTYRKYLEQGHATELELVSEDVYPWGGRR